MDKVAELVKAGKVRDIADMRDETDLSGLKLTIDLKRERLVAAPACRVEFTGNAESLQAGPAAKLPAKTAAKLTRTVVTADRGDLGYGDNLLKFVGKVQVRDPRMSLDCNTMDIFLKAAPGAKKSRQEKPEDITPESLAGPDGGKQLERVVCTGKVKAREPRMKLDCDKLTLLFRQAADGQTAPSMFQSHGTELVRILTDGHVVLENIPEKPQQTAQKQEKQEKSASGLEKVFPGADSGKPVRLTADRGVVDLPGNVSEFHGSVKVRQEQGRLDCQDLYLYAKDVGKSAAAPAAATSAAARLASLDDDPFAAAEPTQVPQIISLGDGKELDRVLAENDVVLVRRTPAGGEQRATGQKAEYFVSRRLVELTGKAPQYAQIVDANPQNNGRGEKITVFLDRESVEFNGRVQMEFDRKGASGGDELPF